MLYPLVYSEIPEFDLVKALNNGLMPRHYLSANPKKLIEAYLGNYLRDEIIAEAKIRNVAAFSRFLEAAAFSNGEIVNYLPKFYYFDLGIANYMLKRGKIEMGSESFGSAFEHFIFQELYAHSRYSGLDYLISFWRTSSQIEVDFILGNHEVAIEVKGTDTIQARHLTGLKSFAEEYAVKKLIVVSNDPIERKIGDIQVMPWTLFLEKLWGGEIVD